jgi:hypothetical protein
MLTYHAPALAGKIRICTAGVDPEDWKPLSSSRGNRVVVYWKSGDESFCNDVEEIIRQLGMEPIRFQYGLYARAEYKRELQTATLAVFISSFETQGIALAEAWSMNVPTLVWDPKGPTSWRGHNFIAGSSAPYLSGATGLSWVTLDDLAHVTNSAATHRDQFSPREWVLHNMTDQICSARLLQIIEIESRRRLHIPPR